MWMSFTHLSVYQFILSMGKGYRCLITEGTPHWGRPHPGLGPEVGYPLLFFTPGKVTMDLRWGTPSGVPPL